MNNRAVLERPETRYRDHDLRKNSKNKKVESGPIELPTGIGTLIKN